jgi:hypothetical protein
VPTETKASTPSTVADRSVHAAGRVASDATDTSTGSDRRPILLVVLAVLVAVIAGGYVFLRRRRGGGGGPTSPGADPSDTPPPGRTAVRTGDDPEGSHVPADSAR